MLIVFYVGSDSGDVGSDSGDVGSDSGDVGSDSDAAGQPKAAPCCGIRALQYEPVATAAPCG